MAEDLGQDIGEWLLNNKSELWRHLNSFYSKAKTALDKLNEASAGDASAPNSPDDIMKLDFETVEDAEATASIITKMGLENERVGASIIMTRENVEKAAEWCEYVKGSEDLQRVLCREEEPVHKVVPDKQGFTPCTAKQIEFMDNLKNDGFIKDEEYPKDLKEFSTRDADALIKQGRKRADEAKGIIRIKDAGEASKAAAAKLAQEQATKTHEKLIDRVKVR